MAEVPGDEVLEVVREGDHRAAAARQVAADHVIEEGGVGEVAVHIE